MNDFPDAFPVFITSQGSPRPLVGNDLRRILSQHRFGVDRIEMNLSSKSSMPTGIRAACSTLSQVGRAACRHPKPVDNKHRQVARSSSV